MSQKVSVREMDAREEEDDAELRAISSLEVGTRSIKRCELMSSTLLCSRRIHDTGTGLMSRIICFTSKVELQIFSLNRCCPGCTTTLIKPVDLPDEPPRPWRIGSADRSSIALVARAIPRRT